MLRRATIGLTAARCRPTLRPTMNGGPAPVAAVLRCAVALSLGLPCLAASDYDVFKVKREGPFEFARKPAVTREGDRVTITFETKAFCDVTVAIEDSSPPSPSPPRGEGGGEGSADSGVSKPSPSPNPLPGRERASDARIVRHLACGVLGPNAPEPFQRDTKKQTIVWDGKDDQGRYVDEKDKIAVRVSLGLRARYERALFREPKKRITPSPIVAFGHAGPVDWGVATPLIAAAEAGVFVYDGHGMDHLRLFAHEGAYIRTVYPIPAAVLAKIPGLTWHTAPQDGRRTPLKQGWYHNTLLTSGDNRFAHDNFDFRNAAAAMAVRGGRVALVKHALNRLPADGSAALRLPGPTTTFPIPTRRGKPVHVYPRSAALSPDGRWLYLTCYGSIYQVGTWNYLFTYLNGVARMAMDGDARPEVFLGSMKPGDAGADNAHFNIPTSVACDRRGRVYVSDYLNDRVQVFSPEGAFLKTIRATKPTQVAVHQRTGAITVFSWLLQNEAMTKAVKGGRRITVKASMTRIGPLDDAKPLGSCPLPLTPYTDTYKANSDGLGGWQYRAVLDSWTDPPTIWLVPGAGWKAGAIRLLVERDGALTVKRDFLEDTLASVKRARPPNRLRQYLYVDPTTGTLYVGERDDGEHPATKELIRIDPDTGRIGFVRLPMAMYDMAFGHDGTVYLRFRDVVARFDAKTWRKEVPWDYGRARESAGLPGSRAALASAIVAPGCRSTFKVGGMGVSLRGHYALYTYGNRAVNPRRFAQVGMWGLQGRKVDFGAAKTYTPTLYPGRVVGQAIHVWDERGRVLHEDAMPGLPLAVLGLGIDKDDNLYVNVAPNRVLDGKPYFRPSAGTLIKFRPKRARIISSTDGAPVPLPASERPKRPPDLVSAGTGQAWVEGAEWMYGGVGCWTQNQSYRCFCPDTRFALDYFARSFAPEVDHYSVAVLDTNGNLILRIGRYGNADDGVPLVKGRRRGRSPSPPGRARELPRSIGGDEVGLFYPKYLAVHTDRRLFIADPGNARIVSVWLGYHATERVRLRDVPDREAVP